MRTVEQGGPEKILLTSNYSNTTGFAWKFFRRLHNAIAREMYARGVGIRLSFAQMDGEVRTIDPDIPVRAIAFDLHQHTRRELRAFLTYVRAERIKHVYFTDFRSRSPLFPLMRLAGARHLVVHNHMSVPNPYVPDKEQGLRGAARWGLHRAPWVSADAIYVCSEFVRQLLLRTWRCPEGRIKVIHHGIDVERFDLHRHAIGSDPVHIVLIARAVREKGVHVLLEAAAVLRRMGEERFRITYGGDGPDLESFRKLAKDLGVGDKITFAGVVAQTEELLRNADVVVVPSVWGDAAPLGVLEGMAAGCALVVTDVGGIPEQIGDSGCAIIVRPGDPVSLATALRELISDGTRRLRLGQRARQRVEQQFTEQRFHRQVVEGLLEDCGLLD